METTEKKNGEESKIPHPVTKQASVDVILPDGNSSEVSIDPDQIEFQEEDEFSKENRQGLLKVLTNAIGFDITAITLPVTLNEPESFLMRLCEQMQYSELLDKAALCDDALERMTYISTFAITCYTVAERTGKPFNPVLGETFEFEDGSRDNLRFLAEQVSHHPPIGACHCETNQWKFWQSQCLKTKFTGNSLDCYVVGTNNVLIKSTGEHFKWEAVRTAVHNVIIGSLWIDHYGDCMIVNKKTGETAKINFKACGWFSKGWHEISGEICDAKGTPCISLIGKWNELIYAKALHGYAERLNAEKDDKDDDSPSQSTSLSKKEKKLDKKEKKLEKKEKKKQEAERKKQAKLWKKQLKKKLLSDDPIWVHTIKALPPDKLPCKYLNDWTEHTLRIVALTDQMKNYLPPTDSRLRGDRLALEKGDAKAAATVKHEIEEKQRDERKKREKLGHEWTPKWFRLAKDEDGQDYYEFVGEYWEERQQRMNKAINN